MRHLVVVPRAGLCNRLRAIAAARRLCNLHGAKCTVVWKWGNFENFFTKEDDFDVIPSLPEDMLSTYTHFEHLRLDQGGDYEKRRVPMAACERAIVSSQYVFGDAEETGVFAEKDLRRWLVRPSANVRSMIEHFCRGRPRPIVGVHVRSTDNRKAMAAAPLALYVSHIEKLTRDGVAFFLATDNSAIENWLMHRFPGRMISLHKSSPLRVRWPRRAFSEEEVFIDVLDLFALASCDFIIGSGGSSYSRVATVYNGDPRCMLLDATLRDPV